MLLASVVRLEGMRILDLTFTHVGHPLHRGRIESMESHKGATLASRLTIRFLFVTEERAKGDLPTTRSLSTLGAIATGLSTECQENFISFYFSLSIHRLLPKGFLFGQQ